MRTLTLGISPCPNDTYIFHALLHGLVDVPFALDLHIADVEELNTLALRGALDASKISVGVAGHIARQYALLRTGAALGWGCGPLVVARTPLPVEALRDARIAIPGQMTTANLLLDVHGGFAGPRTAMRFDHVMPAVLNGEADAGVVIHEGRFIAPGLGLHTVLDLGAWWEGAFAMPLPLGVIAVRRDVDAPTARALEAAIAASLAHAHAHPEASADFIRSHAQEMAQDVTRAHIRTFVNDFSMNLGQEGMQAVTALVSRGADGPLPELFV